LAVVLDFGAEVIYWRGPAPFVYVPVPEDISEEIKSISSLVTYGWGCIPVTVQIGKTRFTTSLFPRKGVYMVPVKMVVQKAEGVKVGDFVNVRLELEVGLP
jgi:hypothetical protein